MAKNSTPYDPYRSQQEAIRRPREIPTRTYITRKTTPTTAAETTKRKRPP